jgi:hypothetical protein
MATVTRYPFLGNPQPQMQAQTGTAGCSPPPPCPACGGLTCLCRPRFFAGQVLTEADLNRLEQYVIDKNRLHNRYLHGWGVVCGLEVVCHPCGDRVTVRSGYALSPCGDDIIVCQDDTAMICSLIRQCRPPTSTYPDCTPQSAGAGDGSDCAGATDDWVLAICYNETPARGVLPLRGGTATGSGCGCGGSSSGGCGCGGGTGTGTGASASTTRSGCAPPPRPAPPQCEPTLTCEGYTFLVYKAPQQTGDPASNGSRTNLSSIGPQGGNITRQCYTWLDQMVPTPPSTDNATPADWQQWCCSVKQVLIDLLNTRSTGNCSLFDLLAGAVCPDASTYEDVQSYLKALSPTLLIYELILGEMIRECVCGALLPPCPAPVPCNCVPLATLTVRRGDCKVLSVCNWENREFVLTFPTLVYWLQTVLGTQVNPLQRIQQFCCGPLDQQRSQFSSRVTRTASMGGTATAAAGPTPFARLLSQSWLNRSRAVDARTLARSILGTSDPAGGAPATPFETQNAATFLLVNQVVRPVLEGLLPPEFTQLMGELAAASARAQPGGTPAASPTSSAPDLTALQQAVRDLQATVKAQADEIAKLKKR